MAVRRGAVVRRANGADRTPGPAYHRRLPSRAPSPLRLWNGPDQATSQLLPRRDLLVTCPASLAARVPDGVLLDDCSTSPSAWRSKSGPGQLTRKWVGERKDALTLAGSDLGWIWEVELLRDAFMPVERLLAAVCAAVEGMGAERLEVHGHHPRTVAALVAALAPLGCEVSSAEGSDLAVPEGLTSLSRAQRLLVAAGVGVPQRVRGDVLVVDAPTSRPVAAALAEGDRHRPVFDPASFPALPRAVPARALWQGGWIGAPGGVRRRRSAAAVRRALAAAGEIAPAPEPAAELGHERALELLGRRAPATLALVERNARALATGRIRTAVVPFDSLSSVRVLLTACRAAGVPSLLVQHGYAPEPNDPDKGEADHTAAWAERDAREVRERHGREATVTGNPLAPPSITPPRPAAGGPTLVLVQSATVFSVRWGARVSHRYVSEALRALELARPGTEVVLRPHPLEREPDAYLALVPGDSSLRVRLDVKSSMPELLARCNTCVSGVSTAALQAGVAGVATAFLDVTGAEHPEPFDHRGPLPSARSGEALAEVLPAGEVPGQAELAEALGVVGEPGATRRVLDLIDQLAAASA